MAWVRWVASGVLALGLLAVSACDLRAQREPYVLPEGLVRTTPVAAPVQARNVILIVADDLGWRDSSVYGSSFYLTPALERLAAEGVTFTRAYSASPLCSPTRASLMTGQYPGRLGLTGADGHLPEERFEAIAPDTDARYRAAAGVQSVTRLGLDYITIGEAMSAEGFATAFVGKWHLGPPDFGPMRQGFDFVVGGGPQSGPPGGYFGPWPDPALPSVPEGKHIGDATTDAVIDFLEDHRREPFFLAFFQYDPHAPYQARPADIDAFRARVDKNDHQQSPTMGAMVQSLDRNVGEILDYLEESGLAESTAVIFLSDNGGNMYDEVDGVYPTSNAPLRAGKGNNYEGGVRIPLIVKWPGVTQPGTRTDSLVSTVDFFPTILDMVGAEGMPGVHIDGESFAPALLGEASRRAPIISHFPHNIQVTGNRANASIFDGRYKLYRFFHDGLDRTDRYELYDISQDEGETRDIAAAEPETRDALIAQLDAHLAESASVLPRRNRNAAPALVGGWIARNATITSVFNHGVTLESTGNDPAFLTDTTPQFASPVVLKFSLSSTGSGDGQVYWSTFGGHPMNEETAIAFEVVHDGELREYAVTLPAEMKLNEIRIDPATSPGVFTIQDIRLETANGYHLRSWQFP